MKTTKPLFRFLLPAFLCLMFIGTEAFSQQTAGQRYEKALYLEEVNGKLQQAIDQYNLIIKEFPTNREIVAKSMLHIGICSEKLGLNQASENYRAVISKFPEQQSVVSIANQRLSRLDNFTSEATAKAEESFKVARDQYSQTKFDLAIAGFKQVIQMAPKSKLAEESQLWIGQCLYKQGKQAEAITVFNSIKKDYPESTIIPYADLMISQVQKATENKPKTKSLISPDGKTITDPATGIRYTKINSWAGKKDLIVYPHRISDISPNRRFLLYHDMVIPFEDQDPFKLFENPLDAWTIRLSPDATKVAFMTETSISVVPVSPETGHPFGPVKNLASGQYKRTDVLSWSSDGEKLVLALFGDNVKANLWTLSINDGSLKKVSTPNIYILNPVFTKNESNILCVDHHTSGNNYQVTLSSSSAGKSVTILDSCWYNVRTLLSPDNKWLLYNKTADNKYLYRFADKQSREITTPEEVGEIVSWSDKGGKVYFYKTSYIGQANLKAVNSDDGTIIELGKEEGQYPIGWTPDGNFLITGNYGRKPGFNSINLTDKMATPIEGLSGYQVSDFSPDFSRVVVFKLIGTRKWDISIVPVSIKDCRVVGEPILIFKDLTQYSGSEWSPDGKKIALCSEGDIWICSAEGGNPIQLTKTPQNEAYLLWSPDGNSIATFIFSTHQVQIISVIDGKLLRTYDKVDFFGWTPDGKEITLAYYDGQLVSSSIITGLNRTIANWKEISLLSGLNELQWSPDGKWIAINGYFDNIDISDRTFLINAKNGKAKELDATDTNNKSSIVWSPDSKWIFYYTGGLTRNYLEGTLWEADLSDLMNKMEPGSEKGITTDFDFNTPEIPAGGVPADGSFTDSRDGHVYKYKKVGEQTWMAENLAWLPAVSPASVYSTTEKHYYVYDYNGSDPKEAVKSDNYRKYGVLYNWQAAGNGQSGITSQTTGIKGICPVGWHLPSDTEWMNLERTLGMNESDLTKIYPAQRSSGFVDKKLRSITGWGEDDHIFLGQSGFNALPGGSMNHKWNFKAIDYISYFWTSTALDEKMIIRCIMLIQQTDSRAPGSKDAAFSVRCIKDK